MRGNPFFPPFFFPSSLPFPLFSPFWPGQDAKLGSTTKKRIVMEIQGARQAMSSVLNFESVSSFAGKTLKTKVENTFERECARSDTRISCSSAGVVLRMDGLLSLLLRVGARHACVVPAQYPGAPGEKRGAYQSDTLCAPAR
jgi:hypothetical protein